MAEKKYAWHKVAASIAELHFPESGLIDHEIAGKKVCIALFHDELFACAAKCPHAGGSLSAGYTDATGNIVCPVHRYKFSLHNGRNSSGEGYYLKTYPVEKRDDGIYIGIADTGFFGW